MKSYPISQNLTMHVDPQVSRPIPKEYAQRVKEIWEMGLQEKWLFPGRIVSLKSHTEDFLEGELIEYEAFFAAMHDPSLREALNIHPIGISCRTIFQNRYLVGKRSPSVAFMSGFYELCPSGSIDSSVISTDGSVDLKGLALIELFEETGIASSFVDRISFQRLWFSPAHGIWDIQMDLVLKESFPNLFLPSTKEYEDLQFVLPEHLQDGKRFVPLTREMLYPT